MTLPATPHTIVISSGAPLVSIPNSSQTGMDCTSDVNTLPKYAVGLFDSNGSGPRKRKRLTHLTPEEKIMRRKLKNRVAAQSARDRKRFKMETLEETVQKIQLQAQKLLECNMQLLKRAETLEQENADLRSRLGIGAEVNTTVSGNRKVIEKIKVEFDETSYHSISKSPYPVVPDSILSPDESADESDNITGFVSHDNSIDSGDTSECNTTMECASPEPAVFGEHELDELIPQQQEAVNLPLIHSKVSLAITQNPPSVGKIMPTTTSLICSNKLAQTLMQRTSSSSPSSQAAALDLTLKPVPQTQ